MRAGGSARKHPKRVWQAANIGKQMNGSSKKNRLSPPLMYAFRGAFEARDAKKKLDLRDEAGDRILAGRRTSPRAAITEPLLRREVARDLEGLLNTISLDSTVDMTQVEFVRKSIINFGFPDITHRSIDELTVDDIKDEIHSVLVHYEPRLLPRSLQVLRDKTVDQAELKIRFLVHADLSCDPVNVPVEFVADVELGSGKIVINRL
jgi:type VI secretion system protein ImpF